MKKGILTFHNCANYGAVFQAYALWETLSSLTAEPVELIDYINPKIATTAQIKRMERERSPLRKLKNLIAMPYIKRKDKNFQNFIRTRARLSSRPYDQENLKDCENEYDTIFFGSDQIWNTELTGRDFHYYGDFEGQIRKIAYAASLGKENIEKNAERIGPLLRRFDAIATREILDQQNLEKVFNLRAQHVLDPTLLLGRKQWFALERPIKVPKRYLLLYLISPHKGDFDFAKSLGKKLRIPVLYVTYSWKRYPGVTNLYDVSPEQFLYLLHHCELMVTNSFHGTVLSINFQKSFYWLNFARAGRANVRTSEVLEWLQLQDRVVTDHSERPPFLIEDWTTVEERLHCGRKKSIEYLCRALEK